MLSAARGRVARFLADGRSTQWTAREVGISVRLLILGLVLAAGVGIVPSYPSGQAGGNLRLVQETVLWAAVVGVCAAVLARPQIAAALIAGNCPT